MPLTRTERLDWWRLARTENVGPVAFRQLIGRFGSAAAALDALPGLTKRRSLRIPSRGDAERELDRHDRSGGRLVALADADYPPLLAAVPDAPPLFSLFGDAALLLRPTIGLVGARNASVNGRKLAEILARDLGAQGVVVVSGLARGIDASAHRASLPTWSIRPSMATCSARSRRAAPWSRNSRSGRSRRRATSPAATASSPA